MSRVSKVSLLVKPVSKPKYMWCQFLSLGIMLAAFLFKSDQQIFNPIGLKILDITH